MSGSTNSSSDVRFSVDTDFDGRVHLVAYTRAEVDLPAIRQEFVLEPAVYMALLRDLTSHAMHALDQTVQQMKAGDCDQCKNTRMVSVTNQHGRDENHHCPACSPSRDLDPFARPRVGGGIR